MKNRAVLSTMAAVALLSVAPSLLASPVVGLRVPVQAKIGSTTKMIKFSVRNDSTVTLKFKAGDQEYTLEPGKTVALKLPEGVSVIEEDATPKYAAGAVLVVAQNNIKDATVVLH
jgi:hypothetical protein